jgi:hypothetical protein
MSNVNPALELPAVQKKSPGFGEGGGFWAGWQGVGGFGWAGRRSIASNETPSMKIHGFV